MAKALMINGKVENIFDGNDFARTLGEKLGPDVEQYFRDEWLVFDDYHADSMFASCPGECDRTYELQEHFQNVLRDIKDSVITLMNQRKDDKRELIADQIYEMINSEL